MALPRLSDYTAQFEDSCERQAFIVTAAAKHLLGPNAREDPAMLESFLTHRGVSDPVKLLVKAAVAPMDLAGGPSGPRSPKQAFITAVDRRAVLGQLGAVKIPSANVSGAVQTTRSTAYWVGELKPKPLSALSFATSTMRALKVVSDVAVTAEVIQFAHLDMLRVLEQDTVSAVAIALDAALLDPANAGITDVKPKSLTNGVTPLVAAGDFTNNIGQVLAAISGGAPERPTLVISLQTAVRMTAFVQDLAGIGVRVAVSPAAGANVIGIDAAGVAYVDEGAELRIGTPDLEMSDAPTTPVVAGTTMVSTWQLNQKVVRGERWVNWMKRADAVSYLVLA